MSGADERPVGSVTWFDLTVPDAGRVRDFYREVVGWTATAVDMEGYEDFSMSEPASGKTVGGICHARGPNADLPAQLLLYVTVGDLDRSLERCRALGGKVVAGPRDLGAAGRFGVIRDPAGAAIALFERGGA